MKKVLKCSKCETILSNPIELMSGKDPVVDKPEADDRQPLIAQGKIFKSYDPLRRSYDDEPDCLEFTPQLWGNVNDLLDTTSETYKRQRLSGCCGLAGINGPNIVCDCGREVATKITDCWTPHLFVADPENTKLEDFYDYY